MSKHLNIISYFGGKYPVLNWLIPLLPQGNYHFVDAMCGSANVSLNVDYPLITINDLNDNVINLFEVLRNHTDEFLRRIYFTPFSRSELYKILDNEIPVTDNIEAARQYFTRCQLGYGANGSQNNHKGIGFELKIQKSKFYRVDNWNFKLKKIDKIVSKLRNMQIENKDVFEIINKMDRNDVVIYLDPPYPLKTRKSKKRYTHEQEDDFHYKLLSAVKEIKNAYVAISTYENEIYENELIPAGWYKTLSNPIKATIKKKEVIECLWTNYNPKTINKKNQAQQEIKF